MLKTSITVGEGENVHPYGESQGLQFRTNWYLKRDQRSQISLLYFIFAWIKNKYIGADFYYTRDGKCCETESFYSSVLSDCDHWKSRIP